MEIHMCPVVYSMVCNHCHGIFSKLKYIVYARNYGIMKFAIWFKKTVKQKYRELIISLKIIKKTIPTD